LRNIYRHCCFITVFIKCSGDRKNRGSTLIDYITHHVLLTITILNECFNCASEKQNNNLIVDIQRTSWWNYFWSGGDNNRLWRWWTTEFANETIYKQWFRLLQYQRCILEGNAKLHDVLTWEGIKTFNWMKCFLCLIKFCMGFILRYHSLQDILQTCWELLQYFFLIIAMLWNASYFK
jgi:hypothetical protein